MLPSNGAPANECKDDSDLGDIPVTVDVPPLAPSQVKSALDTGAICAKVLQKGGLVWAVLLVCQGQWRLVRTLMPRRRCRQRVPMQLVQYLLNEKQGSFS